jgi:hypothetical protein
MQSNAPVLEVFKLPQTTIRNHKACIEIQFLEEVRVALRNNITGKFMRMKEECVTTHHHKEEYEV